MTDKERSKTCGVCGRSKKLHSVCDLYDYEGTPIPYICTSCYHELLGCIWREETKEASDRAKLRAWPPDIPDCENPVPLMQEGDDGDG